MNRVSYSQFSMWSKCPYRWKLNYIDEIREDGGNIHTLFGTAMHEVIQKYLTVMYEETIKNADSLDLNQLLVDNMRKVFKDTKEHLGQEICTKEEMSEFFQHGLTILDWLKKRKTQYFSKKGYELIGVEIPIEYGLENDVNFVGYIDLLIYDKIRDRYKIIDIKTSTMGWNKYIKADKSKTDQLLLYKNFFSLEKDIPLDKIDVEYFIVKRKLYEKVDFPQRRVQTFTPANGKPSLNKVMSRFDDFLNECFDDKGEHDLTTKYNKITINNNCKWCEFKDRPEICDRNMA